MKDQTKNERSSSPTNLVSNNINSSQNTTIEPDLFGAAPLFASSDVSRKPRSHKKQFRYHRKTENLMKHYIRENKLNKDQTKALLDFAKKTEIRNLCNDGKVRPMICMYV